MSKARFFDWFHFQVIFNLNLYPFSDDHTDTFLQEDLSIYTNFISVKFRETFSLNVKTEIFLFTVQYLFICLSEP